MKKLVLELREEGIAKIINKNDMFIIKEIDSRDIKYPKLKNTTAIRYGFNKAGYMIKNVSEHDSDGKVILKRKFITRKDAKKCLGIFNGDNELIFTVSYRNTIMVIGFDELDRVSYLLERGQEPVTYEYKVNTDNFKIKIRLKKQPGLKQCEILHNDMGYDVSVVNLSSCLLYSTMNNLLADTKETVSVVQKDSKVTIDKTYDNQGYIIDRTGELPKGNIHITMREMKKGGTCCFIDNLNFIDGAVITFIFDRKGRVKEVIYPACGLVELHEYIGL